MCVLYNGDSLGLHALFNNGQRSDFYLQTFRILIVKINNMYGYQWHLLTVTSVPVVSSWHLHGLMVKTLRLHANPMGDEKTAAPAALVFWRHSL